MVQPVRTFSPYAPPGLAGVADMSNGQFVDRPHTYIFQYPNLGSNAVVTGLYQLFDNDSDFFCRAISTCGSVDPTLFAIRIQAPDGTYLSDDFIGGTGNSNLCLASPWPLIPALFCPGGSRLMIDLQDQSNSGNNIVINFIGVKRYYLT